MAIPQVALEKHIQGLRSAKAAFQALPSIVRDNMLQATTDTVAAIARGAQARLERSPSIQTRNLYRSVTWSVTKSNGRGRVGIGDRTFTVMPDAATKVRVKGILTSRGRRTFLDRPSRRAHFVEFGTRDMQAEPFMMPAAESQKQPYLDRSKRAGKGIERDAAAIGMRGL